MPGSFNDPLAPASKDPAEGSRGPATGGEAETAVEDSRLGAGGDPAEGKREIGPDAERRPG